MANEEQVARLKRDVEEWNKWVEKNRVEDNDEDIDLTEADLRDAKLSGADLIDAVLHRANLSGADLSRAHLTGADFTHADLSNADFSGAFLSFADLREATLLGASFPSADLGFANLSGAALREVEFLDARFFSADLSGADLTRTDLGYADFREANLRNADLREADLHSANLSFADLRDAKLSGADLRRTSIVETRLENANLSNCRIYGTSAWNVKLEGAVQSNLIITDYGEPEITVDNLEIAQFIYLLINNQKLRDVIDTIGKKAVLILGRFTEERLAVLQAIREELRNRDYIPILFDFEQPSSRDVTETVGLLAHMARFVIADLTDAKSIPQELSHIVPDLPSVAVQPLILQDQREYGMFEHWQRYPWVLPIHEYETQAQLITELGSKVIARAEAKVDELRQVK